MQIAHLQNALNEARESARVSGQEFESQRKSAQAEAEARAQADKARLQVSCNSVHPACLLSRCG